MEEFIKNYLKPGKKNVIFIYIMYLGGMIVPILPLVGVYFAYVNMENKNKFLRSHYVLAFRTFWMAFIGGVIATLTTFIYIGPIIYFLVFVWVVVRSIIAIQFLVEDNEHPNPLTFWIK